MEDGNNNDCKKGTFDIDSFMSGLMLGGMAIGAGIAGLKLWNDEQKKKREFQAMVVRGMDELRDDVDKARDVAEDAHNGSAE